MNFSKLSNEKRWKNKKQDSRLSSRRRKLCWSKAEKQTYESNIERQLPNLFLKRSKKQMKSPKGSKERLNSAKSLCRQESLHLAPGKHLDSMKSMKRIKMSSRRS